MPNGRQETANLLEREWDEARNLPLRFSDVSPGSHKRVWWRCGQGHEWQATVKSRSEGSGCPVCANRKIVTGLNDLATTHPELAKEWNYEKNGELTPADVVAGAHRRVWWRCGRGHEWQAVVYVRAQDGTGCPYCAGKRVAVGENDLATLYPEIAAEWAYERNGGLVPEEFTAASNRRVWWRCALGHEWRAMIGARTQLGCGCPYCAGRKVLQGYNDLASQQPKLAKQWYQELNGELKPSDITTGSSRRVWWQCEFGHVWRAAVYSRTGAKKCGCPVCAGNIKRRRKGKRNDN